MLGSQLQANVNSKMPTSSRLRRSELLDQSFRELQAELERHQRFVLQSCGDGPPDSCECVWANCPHKRLLYSVLVDAIRVLDDTRKAFKSRQLENLRRSFVKLLSEEMKAESTTHGIANNG